MDRKDMDGKNRDGENRDDDGEDDRDGVAQSADTCSGADVAAPDAEPVGAATISDAAGSTRDPESTPTPLPTPTRMPAPTRMPTATFSRRRVPIGQPETSTGGLISSRLLGRFACDAVLHAVLLTKDGAILNAGRDVRTATSAQRRALVARDRGCVIPGCTMPAHACEAHHVLWFRRGGRTDIGNLVLICSRHHTEVHNGIWELRLIGGLPQARPPAWLRADRPWIRNTAHQAAVQATDLGTQLRLNFENKEDRNMEDRNKEDRDG